MGRPAMEASGLPGKRDESYRAGITIRTEGFRFSGIARKHLEEKLRRERCCARHPAMLSRSEESGTFTRSTPDGVAAWRERRTRDEQFVAARREGSVVAEQGRNEVGYRH